MAKPDRRLPPDIDVIAFLQSLPPRKRRRAVDMLGEAERDSLDRAWPGWAHEGQRPPGACADGSDWRSWVIMGGRGFGKTLAGAQWVTAAIAGDPSGQAAGGPLKVALVGATLEDARRVMVEGKSGLIEVAGDWVSDWQPSLRRLRFRTGAEATLFSGHSPEMLRGPEHHLAWCDELAKWEKARECWDMLQLGLRLGPLPRAVVTTTPRSGPVLRSIIDQPDTVVTGGPTSANPHTPRAWKRAVHALYQGTRLGRQELGGELLTDTPGALWTPELLERCRVASCRAQGRDCGAIATQRAEPASVGQLHPPLPLAGEGRGEGPSGVTAAAPAGPHPPTTSLRVPSSPASGRGAFARIVIAVDPPSGDGTCGIVACACDAAGIAHVLADHSVTGRSPEGWARAVAGAARIHGTRMVVAETNQGGRMVEAVLRTADPALRVRRVTATVGKEERAAPVAMLFEAGKVRLHGRFPELEAQLCSMIAGGGHETARSGGQGAPRNSPDRADAMVWGLTELMLTPERVPRVTAL